MTGPSLHWVSRGERGGIVSDHAMRIANCVHRLRSDGRGCLARYDRQRAKNCRLGNVACFSLFWVRGSLNYALFYAPSKRGALDRPGVAKRGVQVELHQLLGTMAPASCAPGSTDAVLYITPKCRKIYCWTCLFIAKRFDIAVSRVKEQSV